MRHIRIDVYVRGPLTLASASRGHSDLQLKLRIICVETHSRLPGKLAKSMHTSQPSACPHATSNLINGIEAAEAGHKDEARALLYSAVRDSQFGELPWLWLASLSRNRSEACFCLERALEHNPSHEKANRWLQRFHDQPTARPRSAETSKCKARRRSRAPNARSGPIRSPFSSKSSPPKNELRDPETQDIILRNRILIVDDSATVRRLTELVLKRQGYEVIQAADGLEALVAVSERSPHLILLDVEMPSLDGFQLCRTLRKDAHTAEIPIIMASGREGTLARLRGKWAGANTYLTKPIPPDLLLEAVASHLES